jgi:hypothetical protein
MSGAARALKGTRMETPMKAISFRGKRMAKASTIGPTEKSTTVNGNAESKKGMECGEVFSEIVIWGSGQIAKLTDKVYISGKTATDMKVAGTTALNTEEAPIYSPTVTSIMENTFRENPKVKEYTNGRTVRYTLANSKMVLNMDAVSGEKFLIIRNATDSKVNTRWTKRMVKVPLHGRVATFIMVIMSMMRDWATVRCIGPMAPCTKVNGIRVFSTDVE